MTRLAAIRVELQPPPSRRALGRAALVVAGVALTVFTITFAASSAQFSQGAN